MSEDTYIGRRKLIRGVPTLIGVVGQHISVGGLQDAIAVGMHVAEIRLDLFPEQEVPQLEEYLAEVSAVVPTLLTIRSKKEAGGSGGFNGTEEQRLKLYQALLPCVHAVDVELHASIAVEVLRLAQERQRLTILSWHDFGHVPDDDALSAAETDFSSLLHNTAGAHRNSAVLKIAARIRSQQEYLRFVQFTLGHVKDDSCNVITVGMGRQHGPKSRIVFPSIGSLATYASMMGKAVAPGQLGLEQASELFQTLYPLE